MAARDAPNRKYPTDCADPRGIIFSPLAGCVGGVTPNCEGRGVSGAGGAGGGDTCGAGTGSGDGSGADSGAGGGLAPIGGVGATKDTPPVPAGAAAWLGPVSASSTRLLLSDCIYFNTSIRKITNF